ncbi:uroporphyrinogen-III C-methyltransferase [Guyparkeria halophila]|uniref:Uroporphyrinogen-III C-methyltransferase n=1 Tax=Guyparkeria halophila TaxID=47960 RepID=A0ABZ0YZ26_9GAMM|nr:uroporphyrinogen-III C-methyltransferase [Guyparkeria halophila]WQH16532.1 uroporphyrinogen-III C-methyltransferase [Guyparkeria halophila]
MDKKDHDKQAEETKAGTSAQAGKASDPSAASTSADKTQADNGQADKGQADKGQAAKGGAGKPAAKAGQKADGKPGAATRADKQSSARDASDAKAADNKPSGNPGAKSAGETSASSSAPGSATNAKGGDVKGGGDKNTGAKTAAPVSPARPPRRSATPWLVIGMLILFALAAVGGWQLWQLQQSQQQALASQAGERESLGQELTQEIGRLDEQLGQTRSSVAALEDRGEAIRQEVESGLQAQQDELAERQDHLDARIARIDDRLSRGEIAWKTAEVGFLLTRAQERLTIARDPDGAMLALRLADQRVAALSRPHWLPLRSAISDAIAEIEAAGEGDRVGQALALRRLTDRVEDWPLADEAGGDTTAAAEPETSNQAPLPADAAWYEKAWAATSGWVAGQVTVTRSDTPTRLRERVATDREMRLWLTAVRESLLSRDHDALSTTIDEARDWLESHYATDADGPAKALQSLKRTQERFASREFPSIDAVLDAWERANAREKVRAESQNAPAETDEEDPS